MAHARIFGRSGIRMEIDCQVGFALNQELLDGSHQRCVCKVWFISEGPTAKKG
jgi:hypothetical protein